MEDLKLDITCTYITYRLHGKVSYNDTFNNTEKKDEDFSCSVHAVLHFHHLRSCRISYSIDLPDYRLAELGLSF